MAAMFSSASALGAPSEADHSTLSSSASVPVTSLRLDLKVDFEARRIFGDAAYTVARGGGRESEQELVLDTHSLEIKSVSLDGRLADWSLDAPHAALGTALRVKLTPPAGGGRGGRGGSGGEGGEEGGEGGGGPHVVTIRYSTTASAGAIQWLPPAQTSGKQHPFMFTQCQAIHARSLLPCQDTPRVKVPYTARIRVAEPFTALMSAAVGNAGQAAAPQPALQCQVEGMFEGFGIAAGERGFCFDQPQPIPSYLLALAVGDLAFRATSDYTGVWAEPSVVEAAAYEFAETEPMVAAGSEITGCDYKATWGRYDVLCMPPSFPYGGMENPCLTFVTPTLLAGDRSLATVVIHEISHSWTGNLISNQTWRHFWLNEGWTMFLQRKIIRRLSGSKAEADLDAVVGQTALAQSVDGYGADHDFTRLLPDLSGGIDPDDCFSSVPYEKGCALLFHLERTCGGHEPFMGFIQAYIAVFGARRHVNSHQFRKFYETHFAAVEACQSVDWDTWLLGTGMPPPFPEDQFDRSLVQAAMDLKDAWVQGGAVEGTSVAQWKTAQTLVFLNALLQEEAAKAAMTADVLRRMNDMYAFTASGNAEIRFRWQKLCIRAELEEIVPHVVKMVLEQGRMKFTRPLYRALYKSAMGKRVAVQTFVENKEIYHPICAKMVARDLELEE
jgi:leukotriene-A4 hydrolase